MWLLHLAWRNIWRNKWRTWITVSALSFAVLLSVLAESLKEGIFDNLIKNVVGFHTGMIQVHQKGYQEAQQLDNSFRINDTLQAKLLSHPNVSACSFRLESFVLACAGDKSKGCILSGIVPGEEDKVTRLSEKLIAGNFLQSGDSGIVIGQGLAKKLDLRIDDTLVLIGQGYHGAMAAGQYPVRGILRFGMAEMNDHFAYLNLPVAQELLDAEERATAGILLLKNDYDFILTRKQLSAHLGNRYEVMTREELLPKMSQHIKTDSGDMRIVQWILYFLIGFGILSTLIMMMLERKYETGMLLALGMPKYKLMLVLVCESLLTVITGCVIGILLSIPVIARLHLQPLRVSGDFAKAYERFGFEPVFPASNHLHIFYTQGLFVLVLGILLSLYPLIRIMRTQPIEALKK